MRKVPELRFDGFEGEWEEKKLKETSKIVGGGTPSTKNEEYWDGEINWFTPSEIDSRRYFSSSGRKITEKALSKSSAKLLDKNKTVLFTSRATIGEVGLLKEDSTTNQGFQSLVIKDDFDLNFMYSIAQTLKRKALSLSVGSTFKEISKSSFEDIEVYTPIKNEQEKIGDLFKKIDDLIEIQEGKVSKMEDFKKSMLQKMFPKKDELVPDFRFDGFDGELNSFRISELIEYSNGNTLEPLITENGDLEVLNLNSVSINGQLKGTSKYISSPYPTLEKNDIIMILSDIAHGNLIGKTAVIPESNKYVLNQRVAQLKPKNIDSYFLSYYINHNQKDLYALSAGTSQLNLSKTEILKYYVRIPALEEQEKIGQLFKNLDTQIENEEKLLDSYKMMKKSLLQKMFV